MGFWQACALILGMTPDVFSRRRNILYVVGWTLSSPRNTMQKTAYALSWDAALYQPVMGGDLFLSHQQTHFCKGG